MWERRQRSTLGTDSVIQLYGASVAALGLKGCVFLDMESAQAFLQESGLTEVLPQGVEGHFVLCHEINS